VNQVREMIDRQSAHMVRLVDDLLDISRITCGKIRLQFESVSASVVVARALETSRPLLTARKHDFTISMPPEDLKVKGDPDRLAQVLANLLNNAAKYTREGGRITLSVEREGKEVVFRVRDNGIGIPREMLTKVFELFTQVNSSLDRSQGGLGIGLTLVHRLVEMHQGTVEALSEGPGRGSEFVVRLSALVDEARAVDPGLGSRKNGHVSPAYRVLVIEDNIDAAQSLAMLLRLRGHEVQMAHDGIGALGIAAAFQPEVVLLDIGLPGLDGFEVARRLRASAGTRGAMLVAITGYGQEEYRRRSSEAGFDRHLVKPIDLQALEEILAMK
jgi:CheY-like chemotaxis protein